METAEKTIESTEEGGAVSMSPSTSLLGKIRTAWCHYNALNAELEYSLSEGGDTDVTRDQVEHAWEDLNSLIMPNVGNQAPRGRVRAPPKVALDCFVRTSSLVYCLTRISTMLFCAALAVSLKSALFLALVAAISTLTLGSCRRRRRR